VAVVFGLLAWSWPGAALITLTLFWGAYLVVDGVAAPWAIANGVFQIAAAIRLRKEIANERLMILSGTLSIAFGVLMIANPGAGALAVLWLIGAFAVAHGALLIILAFRLRRHGQAAPAAA
jgi:uncharacterized membrane protein HdeD (DUF308 family)